MSDKSHAKAKADLKEIDTLFGRQTDRLRIAVEALAEIAKCGNELAAGCALVALNKLGLP